jgi:ABC-type Fe2+-enterobactin transport system substrate-binding protein
VDREAAAQARHLQLLEQQEQQILAAAAVAAGQHLQMAAPVSSSSATPTHMLMQPPQPVRQHMQIPADIKFTPLPEVGASPSNGTLCAA